MVTTTVNVLLTLGKFHPRGIARDRGFPPSSATRTTLTTTYSVMTIGTLILHLWDVVDYNDVTIIVMVIVISIVLEVFQLSIFEREFPQDSDTGIVFFLLY